MRSLRARNIAQIRRTDDRICVCTGAQRYLVHGAGNVLKTVAGVALQHECLPKIKVIRGWWLFSQPTRPGGRALTPWPAPLFRADRRYMLSSLVGRLHQPCQPAFLVALGDARTWAGDQPSSERTPFSFTKKKRSFLCLCNCTHLNDASNPLT